MASSPPVEQVRIPLRDGVRLAADLLRPPRGRRPTVLTATPYGRRARERTLELDADEGVREGFAVVVADVRGRGGSEGAFRGHHADAPDGADAIAWIRRQPWSDGRVLLAGASYAAISQFQVAGERPPGLVALAPAMGGAERDTWYPGGAFRVHGATSWVAGMVDEQLRAPASLDPAVREQYDAFAAADARERLHALADPGGAVRALAAPVYDWFDPDAPQSGGVGVPDGLRLPALHATGWYDACRPAALGAHAKMAGAGAPQQSLTIGPWAHAVEHAAEAAVELGWAPRDAAAATRELRDQFRFFRTVLGDADAEPFPAARTFALRRNRWTSHDAWPPRAARPRRWFLTADGGLRDAPAPETGAVTWRHDPRDPVPTIGGAGIAGRPGARDHAAIERRPDVVCFTTAPLERELELCGALAARLVVRSDAPATDFVARLTLVTPDGRSLNLSEGYRSGALDALPRHPADPQARACAIELGHVHVVLAPGERLRLQVASSDWPEIYPNPNTGHDPRRGAPPFVRVAEQTLLAGGAADSVLVADVL